MTDLEILNNLVDKIWQARCDLMTNPPSDSNTKDLLRLSLELMEEKIWVEIKKVEQISRV